MLDPATVLAFEMHTSKGVFALLIGSGVSRSAKIPTGWEVTVDLIRKLAALKDAGTVDDPAQWYAETQGKAPDYSELLDALATTPAQRQKVIAPYIEPSADERERGEKRPTAAHKAIAELMAGGYVRVVITTNFDRLLELALAELGVHATVLSSADHVQGAVPLIHAGATIIKVHGDYLDTRIRNTQDELSSYDPALDRVLDRVFDEFGLVVCGWSADWDVALKAAIDRAPSRRYPTYWAYRGVLTSSAQRLIDRRAGKLVPISGADSFFEELTNKIRALEALSRPHPLSAELAVGMLKEYLPDLRHRIRLHDLVINEGHKVLRALDASKFSTESWAPEIFVEQVVRYEALLDILLPMAYHAGVWAETDQVAPWIAVVRDLATRGRNVGGITVLTDLITYPASLVMHAYLLGAMVGAKYVEFGRMAGTQVDFGGSLSKLSVGDRLNAATLITDGGQQRFKLLPQHERHKVAASERIAALLRPIASNELLTDSSFDEMFASVEIALALGYAERVVGQERTGDSFWAPPGRYTYQSSIAGQIIEKWQHEYAEHGANATVCRLAGLNRPPRFEELLRYASRFNFFS